MVKRIFLVFFLLFFSLFFVSPQQEITDREVEVGIYVLNLGRFDISTGSFTVDFYMSFKCENRCPKLDFEFMNGRANTIEKIFENEKEKFYRIQANLISPIDLRKFPFDRQIMQIIIEDKKTASSELVFLPNKKESGIDKSIFFTGWIVENWTARSEEHLYEIYNEKYSRFIFEIPISRIKTNSIFKTFLPVIFIMLVMLSSFILDPDKITTRLSMVGSALIASVMFHVSLSNQLPPLGYLTFIDKFMLINYFIILISFLFNVVLLELVERKKEEKVKKLHKITEFTIFIIVLILYFILFIFFI
ncbi:MAG: hypothetical protein QW103_00435 [Candidatus Pacearchaeota archaeon]